MTKPAPYSTTDAAENDAVNALENSVDSRFAKCDIRTRDKYPNTDGTIEIVDRERVPLGKLEVQVRKIGLGDAKYSCPASLVAYSEISTLPVLLICVDPETPRVFWKQILPTMPEFKENQETFTIHFSETSDTIDEDGVYLQKWTEIVRDYQMRILEFPVLRAEVANKLELDNIEPDDRVLFQRFIGEVNGLLDNEFVVVKQVLYPGVWQLGVGIFHSDQERIWYQIYRVPYGEPSPLVCRLDRGHLISDQPSPYAITDSSIDREAFEPPEEVARRFILGRVRRVFENRSFPVHGRMLAADVLFGFVDEYHRCLGVEIYRDSYSTEDLDDALNNYLLGICARIASEVCGEDGNYVHIDLDWLSRYLEEEIVEPLSPSNSPVRFSVGSERISVRAAFESLRYLVSNEIGEIDRPFVRRSQLHAGGQWIWSGYSREDEVGSVTSLLSSCLEEYRAFVEGNRFRLPNSPYLDTETSIIFEYEPVGMHDFSGSLLKESHVHESQGRLPKLSVFVRTEDSQPVVVNEGLDVEIEGVPYEAARVTFHSGDFFFRHNPVVSLTYQMLADDLFRHYGLDMESILP